MHWHLITRNRPALLWAVLSQFPTGSRLSLEGDLDQFQLLGLADASTEETTELRRNTSSPVLGFVTLPVSRSMISALQKRIAGPEALGSDGAVIHVQVEYKGKLVFAAYDNFHEDCVVAYPPLDRAFLERLRSQAVIASYEAAA